MNINFLHDYYLAISLFETICVNTFEYNLVFIRRPRPEAAKMLQSTQRGKVNQATARSISEGKKQGDYKMCCG